MEVCVTGMKKRRSLVIQTVVKLMGHGVGGLSGLNAQLHVKADYRTGQENALGLLVVGHVMGKVLKREHVHQVVVQ